MNAVIYARYSPGPQQTEQSIEGQIRECRKYAELHDIRVTAVYSDSAQSGHTSDRADFQRMLRDAKSGRFDAVIVWKVNRFGRCREEVILNKSKLKKAGVRVLYAAENIPEGKDGILLESVLEGLAEYQWETIREDVIRGMTEGAYHCKYNGSGLALGYRIDADKHFLVDEQTAPVVRKIFEMYDSGSSCAEILRYLDGTGVRTIHGKPFAYTGLMRILRNNKYIGTYRWRDIEIPDGIPAIVDKDLFERVQEKLAKKKKAPARSHGDVSFLLTTKLYCGICKGPMVGDSGTGKSGTTYYYYSCMGRKRRLRSCDKKSVPKDELERLVVENTVRYVLRDDVIEHIADRVMEAQRAELADTSMADYHRSKLAETEAAIKNIVSAIEQGMFSESLRDRLAQLEAERGELQAAAARDEIDHPQLTREQVIFFLEMFRGGDVDDPEYRQKIIDTFIDKIYLYDDKLVIGYNYSGEPAELSVGLVDQAAGCSDGVASAPPKKGLALASPFFVQPVFPLSGETSEAASFHQALSTAFNPPAFALCDGQPSLSSGTGGFFVFFSKTP